MRWLSPQNSLSEIKMTVEDKVKECLWSVSLGHEMKNFDADTSQYPIITGKADSRIYMKCDGCNGKNESCKNYLPRRDKRFADVVMSHIRDYARIFNVFSLSGSH